MLVYYNKQPAALSSDIVQPENTYLRPSDVDGNAVNIGFTAA